MLGTLVSTEALLILIAQGNKCVLLMLKLKLRYSGHLM